MKPAINRRIGTPDESGRTIIPCPALPDEFCIPTRQLKEAGVLRLELRTQPRSRKSGEGPPQSKTQGVLQ
jgi:hypothetical protein